MSCDDNDFEKAPGTRGFAPPDIGFIDKFGKDLVREIEAHNANYQEGEALYEVPEEGHETPHGTFEHKYSYHKGCLPLKEFSRGIDLLEIDLENEKQQRMKVMLARKPSSYSLYKFEVELGQRRRSIGHQFNPKTYILEKFLPRDARINDALRSSAPHYERFLQGILVQTDVDMASARIEQVTGYSKFPRRDIDEQG